MDELSNGADAVVPYLSVKDVNASLAFYRQVFGAVDGPNRILMPDGTTAHGEMLIGNSMVMIADESPDWGNLGPTTLGGSPVRLHVAVNDVDAVVERARAAGARILIEPSDQFYGHRAARFEAPDGHVWVLGQVIEEVSPEEMQARADKLFHGG